MAAVRDIVGYEVPIASDHFGHMGVENCIRIGKALDRYSFAWYEDMIPWQFFLNRSYCKQLGNEALDVVDRGWGCLPEQHPAPHASHCGANLSHFLRLILFEGSSIHSRDS